MREGERSPNKEKRKEKSEKREHTMQKTRQRRHTMQRWAGSTKDNTMREGRCDEGDVWQRRRVLKGRAQWQERDVSNGKEKEKEEKTHQVAAASCDTTGDATCGKGVAKAERGDRARATLEEGAKRGDKGDAWQRCGATEATRDEGVGTRGHVDGGEGKGQQMKKKKYNKDARGGCSIAQQER